MVVRPTRELGFMLWTVGSGRHKLECKTVHHPLYMTFLLIDPQSLIPAQATFLSKYNNL